MRFNSPTVGVILSVVLFIPVGTLDMFVAFNNSIGNWASLFMILPYLVYFGIAAGLRWKDYTESAKGLAIGGAAFSTLIVAGIFFFALMFAAATEFG